MGTLIDGRCRLKVSRPGRDQMVHVWPELEQYQQVPGGGDSSEDHAAVRGTVAGVVVVTETAGRGGDALVAIDLLWVC
jgi:hypothetical protein